MNKLGMLATLPSLLDEHWVKRLLRFERLYLAYSGGLDSTVLLAAFLPHPALLGKLRVVHIHHGISPHADAWALHCQAYCQRLGLTLLVERVAVSLGSNLEERARNARYQVFEGLLQAGDACMVAHHQTDQTETFLLNVLRGAGVDGLAAMPEQRPCGQGVLLRPFLQYPQSLLETYATEHALEWIEDESNASDRWSRSYLRQQVLPLLRTKWPQVETTIAASAWHCQQAKRNLDALATIDCADLTARTLTISPFLHNHPDRLRNVLRRWIKYHTRYAPSAEILRCVIDELIAARPDATPQIRLGTWQMRRYRHTLYLLQPLPPVQEEIWHDFPKPLPLSAQHYLEARPQIGGVVVAKTSQIEIRYRRGGEHFYWRGQTRSLKTLLQAWAVPPWQRERIPLLYVDQQLRAIIGFAQLDSVSEPGYSIVLRNQRIGRDDTTFN